MTLSITLSLFALLILMSHRRAVTNARNWQALKEWSREGTQKSYGSELLQEVLMDKGTYHKGGWYTTQHRFGLLVLDTRNWGVSFYPEGTEKPIIGDDGTVGDWGNDGIEYTN